MNYTTQAQEVLKLAAESAKLMQHPYIGTEHLLIGLSKIYSGVAGQVLDMNGVKEEDLSLIHILENHYSSWITLHVARTIRRRSQRS